MFLCVIGGFLIKNVITIKAFVGIIACIVAIYIPLVYSRVFQLMKSKKLGEAAGLCESVQGLASGFAPLSLEIINLFKLSYFSIGLVLGAMFFVAFIVNVLSSRNGHA